VLNNYQGRTQPYADLTAIERHPNGHHNVFRVLPHTELIAEWDDFAVMGAGVRVRAIAPTPQEATQGEPLLLHLGLRFDAPLAGSYRFFAHLQGDPTPYEGGTLYSTGDAPLCALAAAAPPGASATLVQALALPIPPDLAPGDYHVAIGLYDPATATRLPLQTPSGETRYYDALRFRVVAAD